VYRYLKIQVCHNIIKITDFWLSKDYSLAFFQWFSCCVYVQKLTVTIFLFYNQYSHFNFHIVIVLYCYLHWCITYDNEVVLIVVHTLQFVRVLSSNYVQYSPLRYALRPLHWSVTHIFCVWSLVGETVLARRSTDGQKKYCNEFTIHQFYEINNNYLLTYSMEQSPAWEANRISASQEISRTLQNPKVHYRNNKCPQPVPTLSQINPVHSLVPLPVLILSSHIRLGLPSDLMIPRQNPVKTLPSYVLHAPTISFFSVWSSE